MLRFKKTSTLLAFQYCLAPTTRSFPAVLAELEARDASDILVFGGGVIPDDDASALKAQGVAEIFTPGSSLQDIVAWIQSKSFDCSFEGGGGVLKKLPKRVRVYEVGPRDGLQNEEAFVPSEDKIELIEALIAAGLPAIEITSFVHPRWIPALADADRVAAAFEPVPDITMSALVPNERGLRAGL